MVEDSFRTTKRDLKVLPVHYWKPDRLKAYIAIAYMAFACVQHLAYRMSPERIRTVLAAPANA